MVTGLLAYYGAKSTALITRNSLVQYEKQQNLQQAIEKKKTWDWPEPSYYLAEKIIQKTLLIINPLKILKELPAGTGMRMERGV